MFVLIAFGPCLMMGMATLALYIVHSRFSRTRHALLWATASATSMLQWGLIALRGARGGPPVDIGLAVHLLALAAVLLLAEGFRVRAHPTRFAKTLLATAALAAGAQVAVFVLPAMPIRAAVTPLASAGLFAWMAWMVGVSHARTSATHVIVTGILLAVALVHAIGAAFAIGEQMGLVRSHMPYQMVYVMTVEPMTAAVALATLMLIALDFSIELQRLVQADPLTGVLNREGFDHAARLELDRRKRRPLAVAIVDIDHFKGVNDRHGHLAGDRALREVARYLADRLGRDGIVARIGGEEFALLLPGLDDADAFARIEPLRANLTDLRIEGQPELRLSASFGIAQRAPGEPLPALMERADTALYRSKREGRDRTTLAEPAAESAK